MTLQFFRQYLPLLELFSEIVAFLFLSDLMGFQSKVTNALKIFIWNAKGYIGKSTIKVLRVDDVVEGEAI